MKLRNNRFYWKRPFALRIEFTFEHVKTCWLDIGHEQTTEIYTSSLDSTIELKIQILEVGNILYVFFFDTSRPI